MNLQNLPFEKINAFQPFFLDFVNREPNLKSFYNRFPEVASFKDQIREKAGNYGAATRQVLVKALRQQYSNVVPRELVEKNLGLLEQSTTYTVTTGHQLNVFTGPLYFIYKIVTVINACRELKAHYPDCNFVPVYWMASEDHDYQEIKSFRLFGKKYTWETQQSGAVGRFHTRDFKKLLGEVPGAIDLFKKAYTQHDTLAAAVRYYVNELFGDQGLVVVDGDDRELKTLFKSVIKDDLFNHSARQKVDVTNAKLESLGYTPQIYCRDINFFYLHEGLRNRIEQRGDEFVIVDTDQRFSRQEMEALVDHHPERFSPNVILRPLFEEIVLPNLAYCGGPAEVVYWLQLKDVFAHYQTSFPVLLPRSFALVVDEPTSRKLQQTGLAIEEIFTEKNALFNDIVLRHSRHKIKLNGERDDIERRFAKIQIQVEEVDKTLAPMVAAETRRLHKSLDKIEQKLLKAEKRKHDDKLRQVEALKDALFPGGGLQERTDNFLNFHSQHPGFIPLLLDSFKPFDLRFNIVYL